MADRELDERDQDLADANLYACAYNAAVNSETSRGIRKMQDLIRALNAHARVEGYRKLARLKQLGIITDFKCCDMKCEIRPGGLFHVPGCENDSNHPVYKARTLAAHENLLPRNGGMSAAIVALVGKVYFH